jgi:pSer/pThr/pTyr-binding forkhead associated (FHA) protein
VNILGRDPDADLTIDGPTVSRHHARIVVSGASAILEDLGSKNGTFVRGVRVKEPRRLVNADEVGFGSVRFVFQHRNLGGKTRTASRR